MIVEKDGNVKKKDKYFLRIIKDLYNYSIKDKISLLPAEFTESSGSILNISEVANKKWKKLEKYHLFKENKKYYWIRKNVKIPNIKKEDKFFFEFKCGDITETLFFINRELFTSTSTFLWDSGKIFSLPDSIRKGEIEILINIFTGDTEEDFVKEKPQLLNSFKLLIVNINAYQIYEKFKLIYEISQLYGKDSYEYNFFMNLLEKVWLKLDFSDKDKFYKSIKEGDKFFQNIFNSKDYIYPIRMSVFGHAHLDLAWLWTLKESTDKAIRMFTKQLNLIKKYKKWIFQQGQAQLYEFIKESAPDIYKKIKQEVQKGRWEPSGANWVEFDTNISGGESLIRQIMYGKEFFKKEFNKENRVLWLPDVFGYSASLPQILKKSGVDLFITTKISWNDTTRFPYDTFYWQGIDGTKILTHFVTTPLGKDIHTYNTMGRAEDVWKTYVDYQQKDINGELVMPFGYGDGGGGPTEEMVRRLELITSGIKNFVRVEYRGLEDYKKLLFNSIKNKEVPYWVGELYLEFHRGVFTTQAEIKKNNRKFELILRFLDMIILLSKNNKKYFSEIKRMWKVLLKNQFHDILPGSSIRSVYQESKKEFESLYKEYFLLKKKIEEELFKPEKKSFTIFNPYNWAYEGYIEIERDKYLYVDNIPSFDFKEIYYDDNVIKLKRKYILRKNKSFANNYYSLILDKNTGNILDLRIKGIDKIISLKNEPINVFETYEDKSIFDFESAWDIEYMHQYKIYEENGVLVEPIKVYEYNDYTIIKSKRKILHSIIEQKIIIFNNDPAIYFNTKVLWNEDEILLKVRFPFNIKSNEATYNIQFGNITRETYRNNAEQHAKFEVPAHKWIDLSEFSYGVSLITDSKYGYSVKDNIMRISLLRSPINPDNKADRGEHHFTYALYPHKFDWRKSKVEKIAYQLNFPAVIFNGKLKERKNKFLVNITNQDSKKNENLIIETIKLSEDNKGIIVRLYESKENRGIANIKFGMSNKSFKKVYLCNLIEEEMQCITENYDNEEGVEIEFTPYEIITLKFV